VRSTGVVVKSKRSVYHPGPSGHPCCSRRGVVTYAPSAAEVDGCLQFVRMLTSELRFKAALNAARMKTMSDSHSKQRVERMVAAASRWRLVNSTQI